MELTNEAIQEFLNRQVIEDGVIINMALEGGKVLEKAKNPIFSVVWYRLFLAVIQDRNVESSATEPLIKRHHEALAQREEFEDDLSEPIIDSAELAAEFPNSEN